MEVAGDRIAIWAFGRAASGAVVRRADGGMPRCFLDLAPGPIPPDEHGRLTVLASVQAYDGRLPRTEMERLARSPSAGTRAELCAFADDLVLLGLLLDQEPEVRAAAVRAEQQIESRIIAALSASSVDLESMAEGEVNQRVLAAIALNPAAPTWLLRRLAEGRVGQPPSGVVVRATAHPGSLLLGHLNTYPEHVKQARLRGARPCG